MWTWSSRWEIKTERGVQLICSSDLTRPQIILCLLSFDSGALEHSALCFQRASTLPQIAACVCFTMRVITLTLYLVRHLKLLTFLLYFILFTRWNCMFPSCKCIELASRDLMYQCCNAVSALSFTMCCVTRKYATLIPFRPYRWGRRHDVSVLRAPSMHRESMCALPTSHHFVQYIFILFYNCYVPFMTYPSCESHTLTR